MEFIKKFQFGERSVIGLSDAGDVVIRPNHISVHIKGAHAMFYDPPTWNGEWGCAEFKFPWVQFDLEMDEQTFRAMLGYIDWVRE